MLVGADTDGDMFSKIIDGLFSGMSNFFGIADDILTADLTNMVRTLMKYWRRYHRHRDSPIPTLIKINVCLGVQASSSLVK